MQETEEGELKSLNETITPKPSKLLLMLERWYTRRNTVIQERRGNWRRIPWSLEKVIFVRERERPVVEHNGAHFK